MPKFPAEEIRATYERYVATRDDGSKLEVVYDGLGTMSKSKNNGVDPQGLVEKYGAASARLVACQPRIADADEEGGPRVDLLI